MHSSTQYPHVIPISFQSNEQLHVVKEEIDQVHEAVVQTTDTEGSFVDTNQLSSSLNDNLKTLSQDLFAHYCLWDYYSLSNAIFGSHYSLEESSMKSYSPYRMVDSSIQRSLYENHLIYSKNDINWELLKDFEYAVEVRISDSGRNQTIYIWKQEGCNKEFLRTWNLLDHVRMHSGIKPNMCLYCGKGFTQKSNLRKHMKVHIAPDLEQRKRYSCDRCGSKYTERYNFKKHLKKAHGVDKDC